MTDLERETEQLLGDLNESTGGASVGSWAMVTGNAVRRGGGWQDVKVEKLPEGSLGAEVLGEAESYSTRTIPRDELLSPQELVKEALQRSLNRDGA